MPDPDAADIAPRRLAGGWLPALLGALLVAIVAGVVIFVVAARRMPELTVERLEVAQAKWAQHGPRSYKMRITIGGTRPGSVDIEVQNGEAVAMQRDGQTPRERHTWNAWTVRGMFDVVERELEIAENPEREMQLASSAQIWLRCDFDARYGYPARFHRAIHGGGPEVYWEVERFEVKP